MGLPQRAAHASHPTASSQAAPSHAAPSSGDPLISVDDWLDDEESEPWCVDHGSGMQVMASREIYQGVATGSLSLQTKVWRDGRACWLPIAECYELMEKPAPARDQTPVSAIRRIRARVMSSESFSGAPTQRALDRGEMPRGRPQSRNAWMLTTSFAIGVILGALLYLPFAW